MERIFFVSDCHLSEDRPRIIELFRRFLHEHAASGDALYILGDLFDYWVGDDAPSGELACVTDCLRDLTKSTPVYFIHGNRDFLVGRRFAESSGCRLLDEINVINIQGQRTLLLHGDLLCVDDIAYQRYRKIIRSRLVCGTVTHLPLKLRLAIARRLRRASRRAIRSKKPEIMDVSSSAVADYASRFKVNQIIHGHTHRPAIHVEEGWRRIVLGDWYEGGNYLVMENGTPQLKNLEPIH